MKSAFKQKFFGSQSEHFRITNWQFYLFHCVFIPCLFSGLAIGFHAANPCVNYTSVLFITVTTLYSVSVVCVAIATAAYLLVCQFCSLELIMIHQFELVSLHASMASALGFYDLYTYTSSGYAAFGSFIQFFMSGFLIWISLMERHSYTCYQHFEKQTSFSGNQAQRTNIFYAFFHLSWIIWFTILGFALAYDYELWEQGSGRNENLCL